MKNRLLDSYTASQAAEEHEELNALKKLKETIPSVIRTATSASESAIDPKYIGQIQQAEEQAEEAQQTFNESVTV